MILSFARKHPEITVTIVKMKGDVKLNKENRTPLSKDEMSKKENRTPLSNDEMPKKENRTPLSNDGKEKGDPNLPGASQPQHVENHSSGVEKTIKEDSKLLGVSQPQRVGNQHSEAETKAPNSIGFSQPQPPLNKDLSVEQFEALRAARKEKATELRGVSDLPGASQPQLPKMTKRQRHARRKAELKVIQQELKKPERKHNVFTHFPKDPNCDVCQAAKMQKAPCKRSDKKAGDEEDPSPVPKKFADAITADHMIFGNTEASRKGYLVSMVIQDRTTSWIQSYPA